MQLRFTLWAACLAATGLLLFPDCAARADDAAASDFFESRIRPALIEYCYECHNSQQREGGLALDSRDGVRVGGDRQRELGAKAPRRNLILEAIRHDHDDLKMPEGGAKLSPQTIADFEKWFAAGAIDPRDQPPAPEELVPDKLRDLVFAERAKWWALQPLAITAPPSPPDLTAPTQTDQAWPQHPIDRFTFAAMRRHDLVESPPASRPELLRRLTFALTGLPPTPQELDHFRESAGAESVEQAIDRLLASPHFGQRWARHWMDWIRYAESHGSEGDPPIPYAYRYRDYLIRALNADVPYDQLVREHLAGDLLDQPRINTALGINESIIGPAHLRMVFHGFAPTDALEERIRFIDDQVAAISKSFLGLTVACARCHDHKFDAIRQKDYYALFGILGSCHPGIVDANTPERQTAQQSELTELKKQLRGPVAEAWLAAVDAIFHRLLDPEPNLEKAIRDARQPTQTLYLWRQLLESRSEENGQTLSASVKKTLTDYRQHAADLADADSAYHSQEQATAPELDLEQWFAEGNGSCRQAAASGDFTVSLEGSRAIDSILPAGHHSHLLSTRHRNVWLSPRIDLNEESELWLLVAGEGEASVRYAVQDYPRNGTVYPVTPLNDRRWRWQKYDLGYWQGDSIHIELTTAGDAPVLVRDNDRSWFGIREARLIRKGQPAPVSRDFEQFALLAKSFAKSAPETIEQLKTCWTRELREAITAWRDGAATDEQALWLDAWVQARLLPERTDAWVERYRESEAKVPLPTRVPGVWETVGADQALYVRGDHRQATEPVPRGFVGVLDNATYRSPQSGRLELAGSILGKSQALTARVIVNRLWHHLFGRGLVATPDNFGKLGVAPTHPELLDYLAQDLIDNGWSLKQSIRLIVTSQTWQQTSHVDPNKRARDAENIWLARAPLRRLEAEAIRDAQLAVAGRLDRSLYGPAVDGAQPRRSVYLRVLRNSLDPQLRAFDFPEPTSTIGRRDVTNVPAQSLMLLNNLQVRAIARAWAQTTLASAGEGGPPAMIDEMFQKAFGRAAQGDEVADVIALTAQLANDWHGLAAERDRLNQELVKNQAAAEQILAPARERLQPSTKKQAHAPDAPQPIAAWEFDDAVDAIGGLSGEVIGKAELIGGALVTSGGYFKTARLPLALKAKTLEAWVTIEDLQQRGGGVMSIQSLGGEVFDSIVLGEQRQGHWIAGSNVFARTKPFEGSEESVSNRPIHLAVVYASDGRITGYRDGVPYGKSYMSVAVQTFDANNSVITFGCRHLPPGGNKQLKGRWERARLYDRALSAEEVAASFTSQPHLPSEAEVVAQLNQADGRLLESIKAKREQLRVELQSLGEPSSDSVELSTWTDVALALMNAKEFIFVE